MPFSSWTADLIKRILHNIGEIKKFSKGLTIFYCSCKTKSQLTARQIVFCSKINNKIARLFIFALKVAQGSRFLWLNE